VLSDSLALGLLLQTKVWLRVCRVMIFECFCCYQLLVGVGARPSILGQVEESLAGMIRRG
jgi:hypothetical protein